MGIDDDIIMESPYGSLVNVMAPANEGSGIAAANVTLLITELDRGQNCVYVCMCLHLCMLTYVCACVCACMHTCMCVC